MHNMLMMTRCAMFVLLLPSSDPRVAATDFSLMEPDRKITVVCSYLVPLFSCRDGTLFL